MTKSLVRHIPDSKQKEKGTKQKILDSALEEFSKHGLAGSRVEQIAERAGVNKAMLYYHYSSKENLYQEVIESIFRVATERLSEILITPQSLEEIFKEMIEFYTDLFTSQPAFTPILIRELANSESRIIESIAEFISASGAPVQIKRLNGCSTLHT
jgi:AcrR family transcriptional regulator